MVEEAERYAAEDRRRREQAEQLNAADAVCYQVERLLADCGAKLTNEQRQGLEAALHDTREAVAKRDAHLATERAESLKRRLQEAGAAIYAQAAEAGSQPRPDVGATTGEARPTGPGPGGRVVDADYREAGRANPKT
jgi:molecular chaperone DnaK